MRWRKRSIMNSQKPSTCGQGLAMNAVLPAALGRLMASISDVLEAHTRALVTGNPAAEKERGVYAELSGQHRRIAGELTSLSQRMEQSRDLPMAPHDLAILSAPSVMGAFETSVKLERELVDLLGKRVEEHQQMLVEWLALAAADEKKK
jgi:hypothetical protein